MLFSKNPFPPTNRGKYRYSRLVFCSVLAAALLVVMGIDTGRIPWGEPEFWFIAYAMPALGLLSFAWRPSTSKLSMITSMIVSLGTIRGYVHLQEDGWLYPIAHNLMFALLMYLLYIHVNMMGTIPQHVGDKPESDGTYDVNVEEYADDVGDE